MKNNNTMKKILAVLLSLALAGSLTACAVRVQAKELLENYERNTDDRGEVTEEFVRVMTEYAFRFLNEAAAQKEEGNMLVSPLSAVLCLALITNGADGETRRQVETLLGTDTESLNRGLYAYAQQLAASEDVELTMANSVWYRDSEDLLVKEDYLQEVVNWYDAQLYRAAFDEKTRTEINDWCAEHTDGLIKEILDKPIDDNSMLYLINALLFDAKWDTPYERDQITDGYFRTAKGEKQSVSYLNSSEFTYFSSETAKGAAKEYKGGAYSFVGLLPLDEWEDIYEFAEGLSGEAWSTMWNSRTHEPVKLRIPEFRAEDDTDLIPLMSKLGVTDMFGNAADFTPMAEHPMGLYVSEFEQKTYIEVDRNGTKAAAITWADMRSKSAAPTEEKTVYLTRPFVYMIVDNATGLPLFTGVCTSLE